MPSGRLTHAESAQQLVDQLDAATIRRQMTRLRAWFRKHGRDLPWRRTRDPYHVLVSELMLQQPQVSRVIDYYERWLTRFPTLQHVAKARPRQVRDAWEGLGYYARARNLQKLAREVSPNGEPNEALPSYPVLLHALPGVGAYTAGAVASFAYEKRAPLLDTNVARVLLRLYAPEHSPKSGVGQRVAWALADAVLPRTGKAAWTHDQAIRDSYHVLDSGLIPPDSPSQGIKAPTFGERRVGGRRCVMTASAWHGGPGSKYPMISFSDRLSSSGRSRIRRCSSRPRAQDRSICCRRFASERL